MTQLFGIDKDVIAKEIEAYTKFIEESDESISRGVAKVTRYIFRTILDSLVPIESEKKEDCLCGKGNPEKAKDLNVQEPATHSPEGCSYIEKEERCTKCNGEGCLKEIIKRYNQAKEDGTLDKHFPILGQGDCVCGDKLCRHGDSKTWPAGWRWCTHGCNGTGKEPRKEERYSRSYILSILDRLTIEKINNMPTDNYPIGGARTIALMINKEIEDIRKEL